MSPFISITPICPPQLELHRQFRPWRKLRKCTSDAPHNEHWIHSFGLGKFHCKSTVAKTMFFFEKLVFDPTARIHTHHWQSRCRPQQISFYYSKHIMKMGKKTLLQNSAKSVVSKAPYRHATRKCCVSQVWCRKMDHKRPRLSDFRVLFSWIGLSYGQIWRATTSHKKKDARKFWNVAKKTRKQCFHKLPIATPHEKSCDVVFCRRCSGRITQRFHCFLRSSS